MSNTEAMRNIFSDTKVPLYVLTVCFYFQEEELGSHVLSLLRDRTAVPAAPS